MKFTLGQAAKETGKSKATLSRQLNDGTISGIKKADGSWEIDASELFRVHPRIDPDTRPETGSEHGHGTDEEHPETHVGAEGLAAELKFLREKLTLIGTMHEKELSMLTDRIEELRQDREDLRHERDSLLKTLQEQALSVRLLTDQRTPPPEPPAAPPAPPSVETARRGFLGLFGRKAG